MGWADCGTDSKGRSIGYGYSGTCDQPGCGTAIDRGLSYACGGMHGENGRDCERYFCAVHLSGFIPDSPDMRRGITVCQECEATWRREYPEEVSIWDVM